MHPDPTSHLTLLYGKQDGFLGFNGSARYDITPITSLFASYSDSVQTTAIGGRARVERGGYAFRSTRPSSIRISPCKTTYFHSKALIAGIENKIGLDRYSALLDYEIRDSLLHLQPNDTLVSGYATWNHEFSDQSDTSFTLGYSRETVDRLGTANAGMQYDYSFTESLKGSVRYDFILRTSSIHSDGFLQNAITLSLRQSF